MRISVIGAFNIGSAHICSIVRTGNDFIGYYDTSDTVLSKGDYVLNKWADIEEGVYIPETPTKYDSIIHLVNDSPDLVIICCPTDYHIHYLDSLQRCGYTGKVLCEKPCGRTIEFKPYAFTLFVGYEWTYHPTLKYIDVNSVCECHSHKPDWVNTFEDTCWDLAGHCISMLKSGNRTPIRVEKLTDNMVYDVFFSDHAHITFGYFDKVAPLQENDITRDTPVTIVNNNVVLRWNDLFDWQLLDILYNEGKNSVDYASINMLVKDIMDLPVN